jgi:hypothetical protein
MPSGVILLVWQNYTTPRVCPKSYPIKHLVSGVKILYVLKILRGILILCQTYMHVCMCAYKSCVCEKCVHMSMCVCENCMWVCVSLFVKSVCDTHTHSPTLTHTLFTHTHTFHTQLTHTPHTLLTYTHFFIHTLTHMHKHTFSYTHTFPITHTFSYKHTTLFHLHRHTDTHTHTHTFIHTKCTHAYTL